YLNAPVAHVLPHPLYRSHERGDDVAWIEGLLSGDTHGTDPGDRVIWGLHSATVVGPPGGRRASPRFQRQAPAPERLASRLGLDGPIGQYGQAADSGGPPCSSPDRPSQGPVWAGTVGCLSSQNGGFTPEIRAIARSG